MKAMIRPLAGVYRLIVALMQTARVPAGRTGSEPGGVSRDGYGRNSPYARHLKAARQAPGLEPIDSFRRVSMNVERETNRAQCPWLESSVSHPFYLVSPE